MLALLGETSHCANTTSHTFHAFKAAALGRCRNLSHAPLTKGCWDRSCYPETRQQRQKRKHSIEAVECQERSKDIGAISQQSHAAHSWKVGDVVWSGQHVFSTIQNWVKNCMCCQRAVVRHMWHMQSINPCMIRTICCKTCGPGCWCVNEMFLWGQQLTPRILSSTELPRKVKIKVPAFVSMHSAFLICLRLIMGEKHVSQVAAGVCC